MAWLISARKSYARELKLLQKQRAKDSRAHRKIYDAAVKAKMNEEDLRELSMEHAFADAQYDDEIKRTIGTMLLQRAESLLLETPAMVGDSKTGENLWEESSFDGRYRLSNRGIQRIRDQIREEEKKRRDERFAWIDLAAKIVAMAVGLIGATIGLVSVLRK